MSSSVKNYKIYILKVTDDIKEGEKIKTRVKNKQVWKKQNELVEMKNSIIIKRSVGKR